MVNYVAVIVTAIIAYAIGALWYSPLLFGKQWMKLMNFTKKDMEKAKAKGMTKAYISTFVAAVVTVWVLAMFINMANAFTFTEGLMIGFWVWLGFFATTMLGNVFWRNDSFNLYLLNIAHYLVMMLVCGGILAVWV